MELTKSTEDYLETIFNLLNQEEEATVKEIANYMKVSLPAVTGAMKNLHDKGYVIYKSYEPVKLTKEGEKIAREVAKRHIIIRTFLNKVLKLNEVEANEEACRLEHAMNPETIKKLSVLMDEIRKDVHFKNLFIHEGECRLCDRKPGFKGRIIKIDGEPDTKRRITEMGLTTGTEVEIIRKAPLGDPIEVKTRGFFLSLRQKEAYNIILEKS